MHRLFNKLLTHESVLGLPWFWDIRNEGLGQITSIQSLDKCSRKGRGELRPSFHDILNVCMNVQVLEEGGHVQEQICRSGCEANVLWH